MDAIRRFFGLKTTRRVVIHLEDLRVLSKSNKSLALKVHHLLSEDGGNFVFSPLGISTGIFILLAAAKGEAEAEMRTAMGLEHTEIETRDLAFAFEKYKSDLFYESESFAMLSSDVLLGPKFLDVKQSYKAILAQNLKAVMFEVDFKNEPKRTASLINEWVRMKTYDTVRKTMQPLDPESVMAIINAMYFRGKWLEKFPKERTSTEIFFNKGDENSAKRAVQIPYTGDEIAMLIILPHSGKDLESMESSLTSSILQDMMANLSEKSVAVSLPRFRLECTKSLIPCYRLLGIESILEPSDDLWYATESSDAVLSEVLHKVVLEVEEDGEQLPTAAVDPEAVEQPQIDHEFVVDHPFVFVIHHKKKNDILFMGRVSEL